jgi:hypothetical protein
MNMKTFFTNLSDGGNNEVKFLMLNPPAKSE